jgi:hypothetical protein
LRRSQRVETGRGAAFESAGGVLVDSESDGRVKQSCGLNQSGRGPIPHLTQAGRLSGPPSLPELRLELDSDGISPDSDGPRRRPDDYLTDQT